MTSMERRIPHFVLASALASYPGRHSVETLKHLIHEGVPDLPAAVRAVAARVIDDSEEMLELESEYIDLFERGRSRNPLHETEYGRDRAMAKGGELADIAGFYRAFGFENVGDEGIREMPDHVAVELEFYALLLMKEAHLEDAGDAEGVGIVRDARRKFLQDHLGRFVDALSARPAVAESAFYGRVFGWCRDLIVAECGELDVNPAKITWATSSPPRMTCGGDACGS